MLNRATVNIIVQNAVRSQHFCYTVACEQPIKPSWSSPCTASAVDDYVARSDGASNRRASEVLPSALRPCRHTPSSGKPLTSTMKWCGNAQDHRHVTRTAVMSVNVVFSRKPASAASGTNRMMLAPVHDGRQQSMTSSIKEVNISSREKTKCCPGDAPFSLHFDAKDIKVNNAFASSRQSRPPLSKADRPRKRQHESSALRAWYGRLAVVELASGNTQHLRRNGKTSSKPQGPKKLISEVRKCQRCAATAVVKISRRILPKIQDGSSPRPPKKARQRAGKMSPV